MGDLCPNCGNPLGDYCPFHGVGAPSTERLELFLRRAQGEIRDVIPKRDLENVEALVESDFPELLRRPVDYYELLASMIEEHIMADCKRMAHNVRLKKDRSRFDSGPLEHRLSLLVILEQMQDRAAARLAALA